MIRYADTVADETGAVISGATVTVYLFNTLTLATLSVGVDGGSRANPMTTGDDGFFEFYADPGQYDIKVSVAGAADVTRTVQLGSTVQVQVMGTSVAAAATNYLTPTGETATAADAVFNTLGATVLSRIRTHSSAQPGGGRTFTYNIIQNGLTVATVTTTGTAFDGSSNPLIPVLDGDEFQVELVTSASATVCNHRVILEFSP